MVAWYHYLVDTGRVATLWAVIGFVVTYVLTRRITLRIRHRRAAGAPAGGSAVKDVHIGGIHVHHQVWGILLVLVVGLLEIRFDPVSPWQEVLGALFGVGAALALDEFALWLHLEDVYWSAEGRKSIDAVMVAAVIGLAVLVGSSPLGVTRQELSTSGAVVTAVGVLIHFGYTIICLLKGKLATGLIGLPIPLVALVGAIRLATPSSFWARRFYAEPKAARARARSARNQARQERLRDLVSGGR